MIRQLVVGEVCRMIGTMSEDQQHFKELLEQVIQMVYTYPSDKQRHPRSSETADQEVRNVQHAAEMALSREVPQYRPEIRKCVVVEIQRGSDFYAQRSGQGQSKLILDRLLRNS